MINKRTVFIIGAGASAEFGFPTGSELKEQIERAVRYRYEFGDRLISGDTTILQALRRKVQRDGNHNEVIEYCNRYTKAGNELADTMKPFPSIDEALHWWRDRPEIVELGKLAIATLIMDAERQSSLARLNDDRVVSVRDTQHVWLYHVVSIALSALDKASVVDAFRNVTLINFNYDRSVEQYVLLAPQQLAGVDKAGAVEACGKLKVIRPYGSIGKLDWQGDGIGLPFGAGTRDLFAMASNIRTYTEQIADDGVNADIEQALKAAHLVVFLGFGFHQQNISLLKSTQPRKSIGNVLATVSGVNQLNFPTITSMLKGALRANCEPQLIEMKAVELLREMRPAISMFAV